MEVSRLFGIIFAWIGFVLLLVFSLKPLLRKTKKFKKLRIFLVKYHNHMGIACIISVLLHVFLSHSSAFSIPFGIIAILAMVISIVAFFFKKKLKKNFMKVHGIFALICLLFAGFHIVETNFSIWPGVSSNVNFDTPFDGLELNDGIFRGESMNGYNQSVALVVEIEIKNSSVISITIISHGESYFPYIKNTEDVLGKYLLENQNSNIETVTGSTYTSRAYLEAVLLAVESAKVLEN